jgi:hypothetical protein
LSSLRTRSTSASNAPSFAGSGSGNDGGVDNGSTARGEYKRSSIDDAAEGVDPKEDEKAVKSYGEGEAVGPDDVFREANWNLRALSL